jgi:hypothetical protein
VVIVAWIFIRMPGSEAEYAPGKLTPAGAAEPEPETVSWSVKVVSGSKEKIQNLPVYPSGMQNTAKLAWLEEEPGGRLAV